ncbi:MAG: S-layer protein, partial [Clostridiales bacterium]|nr:S-layer protein [Clostridiales bacterium]
MKWKKALCLALSSMLLMITFFTNMPVKAAKVQHQIPEIKYASAPATEYFAGDRIRFDIYAPNYGGRVEYRVILWDDSKKTYYDLWNAENGYPNRYYTKWQPNGNTVFTLGWPIFEPGYYRITVLVKRLGIPNNKTALRGMNCDSYMESVAFLVKPRGAEVDYIMPIGDVNVTQGNVPQLPQTVRAVMKDSTERSLRVNWENVDTSIPGSYSISGNVEDTDKKALLRLIVSPRTLSLYTVTALNETFVNVILRDAIDYAPDISRFNIIGNNNIPVRIHTLSLSQDRRVIQLVTEAMSYGQWYKLYLDGKDFSFQIPNPVINRVSIREIQDMSMEEGKQGTVTIYSTPESTTLTAYSSNKNVATVELRDRKLIVKGLDAGAATITIGASRNGYESTTESFNVIVNKLIASPDRVYEDRSFDDVFQLEIRGYGNFRRDFNINDISLGGDFTGLRVQLPNVLDTQSSKARIRLVGNLVYKNGYGTITLNERGWNGEYTLTSRVNINGIKQVLKPVALPEPGEVGKGTQVILYSPTSGAKVYFTIDGTTPTRGSTEFVNPIVINRTTKIKAIAIKSGMSDSEVSTFIYTVKEEIPIKQVSKPVALPDSGDVVKGTQVILYSPTSGAKVYFTTDGRTPTKGSTEFVNPIVIYKSTKIKAIAIRTGMRDSEVSTFIYNVKDNAPTTVTIQDGEYRAVQGNVIGKPQERVYIQKQDKKKWNIIASTNEEGSNGQLKG